MCKYGKEDYSHHAVIIDLCLEKTSRARLLALVICSLNWVNMLLQLVHRPEYSVSDCVRGAWVQCHQSPVVELNLWISHNFKLHYNLCSPLQLYTWRKFRFVHVVPFLKNMWVAETMKAVFWAQLVQNVVLEPMTLKLSSMGAPCYSSPLSIILLMKKIT